MFVIQKFLNLTTTKTLMCAESLPSSPTLNESGGILSLSLIPVLSFLLPLSHSDYIITILLIPVGTTGFFCSISFF